LEFHAACEAILRAVPARRVGHRDLPGEPLDAGRLQRDLLGGLLLGRRVHRAVEGDDALAHLDREVLVLQLGLLGEPVEDERLDLEVRDAIAEPRHLRVAARAGFTASSLCTAPTPEVSWVIAAASRLVSSLGTSPRSVTSPRDVLTLMSKADTCL